MKKLPNWESMFHSFVENNNFPFQWGLNDCCKFSNALIKQITGEDLIPKKLKWKDEASAMKAIASYGGDLETSIEKACNEKGVGEINKAFMTCGDLVLYAQADSFLVGMCNGFGILTPTDDGINVVANELAHRVWRFD
tara:strand:- start:1581 stop:1994 length:414 start_codon:yes stop_codon:yes gene_type:complete